MSKEASNPFAVKRKLALNQVPADLSCLDALPGFFSARIHSGDNKWHLSYDASVLHIDRIIKVLSENGVVMAGSWWQRQVIAYYQFTDTNVRSNALSKPHCCSRPPKNFR